MLLSLVVGIPLALFTVAIHAAGTTWWIRRLLRTYGSSSEQADGFSMLKTISATAVFLLALHFVEVVVWSIAYLTLPGEQFSSIEAASYFSIVTFTSLGYGDIVIESSWRLLSGIQAMAGLLVFGWSTALSFAVMRELWSNTKSGPEMPK